MKKPIKKIIARKSLILVVWVITLVICTQAIAEIDVTANGYDWLKFSKKEKYELINLVYTTLKLDRDKYPVEKGAKMLNGMYLNTAMAATVNDMDITLDTPCLKTMKIGIEHESREFEVGTLEE